MVTEQLDSWQGEFGRAYTDRNQVDWRTRLPAFRTMLGGLELERVLEVGCNRGHNLVTLREGLGIGHVVGIEPNPYALSLAKGHEGVDAMRGTGLDVPFKDGFFDLAFTANVLIHVSLADLPRVMGEIYRASRRYVLAIEYFAPEETVIHYRGHDNLLWKRDFLRHYQELFPDLAVVRDGFWGHAEGFDDSHWWLLEKGGG
jgi:pseudaminic acid biosynthesis-associated methylase